MNACICIYLFIYTMAVNSTPTFLVLRYQARSLYLEAQKAAEIGSQVLGLKNLETV